MSDTPRTDVKACELINTLTGERYWYVPVGLARELERELNEARKELLKTSEQLKLANSHTIVANKAMRQMQVELEALRADMERLDFVEQHPEIGLGSYRSQIRIVGFSPCEKNGWRTTEFRAETYRAAIDAARKAAP